METFNSDQFQFERMIAWQKAKIFYNDIRKITKKFQEKKDLILPIR